MREGLEIVTVTPGSTPAVLSLALPLIAPDVVLVVCARVGVAHPIRKARTARNTRSPRRRRSVMLPSFEKRDDNDAVRTFRTSAGWGPASKIRGIIGQGQVDFNE